MLALPSRDDRGFTLIELMVVVLIIAVLLGIAIPTFLGVRRRAQDRAVQSNIRNAFTAEKALYTDAQQYASSTSDLDASGTADIIEVEPSLTYVATNPPAVSGNTVTLVLSGGYLYVAAKSASGTCFYLRDNALAATQYAKSGDCDAVGAVTGWSNAIW